LADVLQGVRARELKGFGLESKWVGELPLMLFAANGFRPMVSLAVMAQVASGRCSLQMLY